MQPSTHSMLSLVWWLGPWSTTSVPDTPPPERRSVATARGTMTSLIFRPSTKPRGAYVIAHGLHPRGPEDPRFDRFCRILAASGFLVCAPLLPDYLALRMAETVTDDLGAAWDDFEPLCAGLARPALFSISFGSLPVLALACRPSHRARIGAVVLFGGFADFGDTVRFAITGKQPGEHRAPSRSDPLNPPVVFLNLLPDLDLAPDEARALDGAWRAMIARTWGRIELKLQGARDPIAHEIAETLPPSCRELFLTGCGLRPGGEQLVDLGLERGKARFAFANPRAWLPAIKAPVVLVHGRDDDVIPWTETLRIEAALPPQIRRKVFITGLYGHTQLERPAPAALAHELRTLLGVVRALVEAPVGVL